MDLDTLLTALGALRAKVPGTTHVALFELGDLFDGEIVGVDLDPPTGWVTINIE